jgi:hypothetical protein
MISGRQVDEDGAPTGFYSFDDYITHENLPVIGMGDHNYVNFRLIRLLSNCS